MKLQILPEDLEKLREMRKRAPYTWAGTAMYADLMRRYSVEPCSFDTIRLITDLLDARPVVALTPIERQRQAQQQFGYGPIWLRREGEYAIVEIQHEGKWLEVIRVPLDANFSHCIEPLGIADICNGVPV